MMKYIIALLVILGGIMCGSSPVMADEPSDNATEVILFGDSLDAISSNMTLLSDGLDSLDGLSDALSEISDTITDYVLPYLLIAFINILAMWKHEQSFLKLMAVPVNFVFGLYLAANNDMNSPLWVSGIIVAIIGTSFLFSVAMDAVRAYRRRD